MSIPGSVVHQQLMDAYAQAESRLESKRDEVTESQEERSDLDRQRDEVLLRLAEHYLPELTDQSIHSTWAEVQPKLADVFLQKEEHKRRAGNELDDLVLRRDDAQAVLLHVNNTLAQATEQQQQRAEAVESMLGQDAEFVQLTGKAATAEAALERAEANLNEIDQDAARKLPAYEQSQLFRYLLDRKFGTDAYANKGFTRRMDRMLARFIGFKQANQSYQFLKHTPDRMRAIIADDRDALATVMDSLQQRRDEIAQQHHLPDAMQQVRIVTAERDKALAAFNQLRTQVETAQQELGEIEAPHGIYYRQATEVFRGFLQQLESRELKQRARETQEITDDQIVARLMGVELEIDQLAGAARRRSESLMQLREFLNGMGRLIQRFRAAQFDSSRSQFVRSFDMNEELEQALERGDADYLWRRIRRAQRWVPTAMDNVVSATAGPLTSVLVNAMTVAAGGDLSDHARRAGRRWSQSHGDWSGDSSHRGRR